ncbi:MAG: nuclear transport factor 2 family protein [Halobacteriaceae archaeon]
MSDVVADCVEAYYAALQSGEPLAPFFLDRAAVVKVGISEHRVGHGAVADALREQTATTSDWTVESRALRTDRRGACGWFTDRVGLGWTTDDGDRRRFDTRWTGTLVPADGWRFVTMHVSAPRDL